MEHLTWLQWLLVWIWLIYTTFISIIFKAIITITTNVNKYYRKYGRHIRLIKYSVNQVVNKRVLYNILIF